MMSTSVVSTHEKLLKKRKHETGGKKITLKKLGSFRNSSMPSCHWPKMEGLRDQEMRGCVVCFLGPGRSKAAQASHWNLLGGWAGKRSVLPASHRPSLLPLCFSTDNSEDLPQQPAVTVNPSVFLSHAFTRFPSHKRLLLTRSLCSKAVRS